MSMIPNAPAGAKGQEPLTLDALRGARIYAKDLNPGDLIEVPNNAQVNCGLNSKQRYPRVQRVVYGVIDDPGSAFLVILLLDPRWADEFQKTVMDVALNSGRDAARELLTMVSEKWQLARRLDGWFKVIEPACDRIALATPFDEEVSHAA